MNYPVLVLKSGRERSLNNRHPWLFSGAVKVFPAAEPGDIVRVESNNGHTLAFGFFGGRSEIACKLFEFTEHPDLIFGQEYWNRKVEHASQLRKNLILNNHTNCFRLIHAEGDGMPGIVVDVYGQVAVAQVLHRGIEKIFGMITVALQRLGLQGIYSKTKTSSHHLEQVNLPPAWHGTNPGMPVTVFENGLKFKVDVESGQKTGFFLDQRDNRQLLRTLSQAKTVLNTFSYTGGFSVYAAAGQARQVVSVDVSKPAVEAAAQNLKLNFPDFEGHQAVAADCFDYLKQMDTPFDLIVLDPPAFAKNAHAVKNAARGYKELNLLAFRNIIPGGMLFTFSCSKNIDRDLFRKIVFGAAADSGREVKILHQLTQPPDHPVSIYHPEGEYLKGLVLLVD